MRNKKIRVAVVSAMLVLFTCAAAPSQATRPAGAAPAASPFERPFLAQLGDLLVAWTENLIGLTPRDGSARAAKTTVQGPTPVAPRTSEATSGSTDRSGALDPWGVR